ncbi:MAG: hypothetical protein CMI09_15995 [Oceanospirillaceae bacterium]|nr:hypothetical protein [Oceanospirillaceae bacterium]
MAIRKTLAALVMGCLVSQASLAADAASDMRKSIEEKLKAAFGDRVEVSEVAAMADKQLLEIMLIDGSLLHMTPDGNFMIYQDEVYKVDGKQTFNLTEQRQNPRRAESLATVVDKDTVLFPAKGEQKALINVFTDIDCGYCQKLHQEIPKMNELGITVRYLAYPRAGIRSQQTGQLTASYRKINYVWCNDDRKTAMTDMKDTQRQLSQLGYRARNSGDQAVTEEFDKLNESMNGMLASSQDCAAPIESQFKLGHQVGVRGTPAIVVEDGRLFPGYLPADALAERLGIL